MIYLTKSTAVILEYDKVEDAGKVSSELIRFAEDYKVWFFEGEMGVGKTTFIKQLCRELGVKDTIASPTYSIVNEYRDGDNNPIYHFDFYRLNNEEEAMDLGVEDYFYSGDLCLGEWPERVSSLFPEKYLYINMRLTSTHKRALEIEKHG